MFEGVSNSIPGNFMFSCLTNWQIDNKFYLTQLSPAALPNELEMCTFLNLFEIS